MKIDQLIYFNETAKLEHIGKAARVLNVSPSAVSHSIAALETELGYDLFEKKGKNIVLTERGREVQLSAQDLIDRFQGLQQSLLGASRETQHFKLAATHFLASEFLASAWAKLSSRYPKAVVELMTYRSADVVKHVLDRELDFGFCFSPQPHPELEMNELHRGELLIAVRKSHPLLKLAEKERWKRFSSYPAILPKAFQGIELCVSHPMLKKHGMVPSSVTATDSYEIALEVVRRTDCWSFVPDLLARASSSVKFIKPSAWDAPYSVSSVALKKRFKQRFLTDLEAEVRALL